MVKMRKHPVTGLVALLAILAWGVAKPAERHEIFWSVSEGERHVGHVLGTVHSEDPRVLEFTQGFLDRLERCDTFAMELVPDLPTMQRLLAYMELPEGQRLVDLIGEARYGRLGTAMETYGVPDDRLARMKPWAAMMTLSLPPPKTGLFLDFSLSLRASGYGLEVVGLETLEQQLSFLEALEPSSQVELLDQALAEHERVQEVHDAMVDTYLTGDLDRLQSVAEEQMAGLAPDTRAWFEDEGIAARNHRMVERVLPLFERGCAFIAVGALHLPGEEGILALLKKAGYRLEPLPSPFPDTAQDS